MFSIFIHVMSRDTHSEPGLPMTQREKLETVIAKVRGVVLMCEPASHASHDASHASHASQGASHASQSASHASHRFNVKKI